LRIFCEEGSKKRDKRNISIHDGEFDPGSG